MVGTTEINRWFKKAETYRNAVVDVFTYSAVIGLGFAAGYFWARFSR